MLAGLSIRDVVLIDRLDLTLQSGLCVLTGETGAGKSILLDALGLALGGRGDSALIRKGADQAVVSATFEVAADHPARALLREQGLDDEEGAPMIVRRLINRDGRSRVFVNDQPSSVTLLRQIGDMMVEVHGQNDQRGLLDPGTHRAILDAFGGLDTPRAAVRAAWSALREVEHARDAAKEAADAARTDEDFLRYALDELTALDPQEGEEATLLSERTRLMNSEKLIEALNAADETLSAPRAVDDAVREAQRRIERARDMAPDLMDPVVSALERAAIEIEEARAQINAAGTEINAEPGRLEALDDRLFALRDAARKHRTEIDRLPALRQDFIARLDALDDQGGRLARLERQVAEARAAYETAAKELSAARHEAAGLLDDAIARELPPLRLDKARFATRIDTLDTGAWSQDGMDRVRFEASTNPGAAPGPIARIASGGELSRFMLALKVVLSARAAAPTLVFDEVDSGVGGSTAAAVGERLARLGDDLQVLVVTHSPQVAARADHHWRIEKRTDEDGALTEVAALDAEARREEIARMLAGHDVTEEARAAAGALIAGGAA